jgi:hypothetical protein
MGDGLPEEFRNKDFRCLAAGKAVEREFGGFKHGHGFTVAPGLTAAGLAGVVGFNTAIAGCAKVRFTALAGSPA